MHRILTKLKRALAAMLALAMLSCCAAFADEQTDVNSVKVVSAPLISTKDTRNGMVRVYLSSLGSPTALNLTVNGSYSVNGNTSRTLSGGTGASIGFSTSTGAITLSYGGTKTNMGKSFSLRRHSSSGTNGIKISQSKEPNNIYPGDITFKAVSSGGGYKLYTIAHIYIENYLYGVLPYEMGNSTSIEALKAQAVAARTYTVRMMNSRAGSDYDVVDTTSDQVYRGTPSGNANCVSAVDQTKGVVLMYGSSYAMTYYSASNGGQTESAKNLWGSVGYDYLVVKNDPFDYSNPSSTVKSKTVYKDLTSGLNSSALISLLKSKAVTALSRAGYSASSGNTTLVTLKSVTPHTPKYGSPSRLYTKMDFELQAKVNGTTASCTVTCGIFTELEGALSMSIQSASNELWSVKSSSSAFTLQARRYGHAIGLSQRGAMYMAKLGYSYDQILGFYYEGCKRVRHSFTNTILSVNGDTQTTIEDPADVDVEDDACKGTVRLVSSGADIAIRASKSTSGAILGTAGNGAIMKVHHSDGQWCFVEYGDIKGYLPANALQISGTPSGSEGTPSSITGFATVTANDFLNLRASGSMDASIVSTAPSGAILTVFSQSGSWARVQYCATVAYVNTNYVRMTSSYPSQTVSTGSAMATVNDDGASLLASPSTDARVLAQLASGAQLKVSSDDGSWASVSYEGLSGYVLSSSISYDGESLDGSQDGDGDKPDDDPGGSGITGEATATVSADVGFLREQPDQNSSSIMIIARGETVTVTSRGSEWCEVSIDGLTGYMITSSLSFAGGGAGASVGTATVTTQSGSLNLRAAAQAGSAVITTIPRFARVQLTSIGATWCGVYYNGISGYCMTSFLTIEGKPGESLPTPDIGDGKTATVATQSGSLNLRAEPRAGSKILRTIPQYAQVEVISYGAEWCNVAYMGVYGYSMTVFLAFVPGDGATELPDEDTDDPSDEEPSDDINDPDEPLVPDETDENTLYAIVSTVSGSLNLRRDAMPGSDVLARIPKGTTIVIDERLSAWSRTTYAGQTGYVMNTYLSFHQGQQSSANAQRAIVSTASGSLNLRTEPSANSGVILRIPQYATVDVEQRGTTWCYIRYGLSMGYVMTSFLTFEDKPSDDDALDNDAAGDDADGADAEDPSKASTAYVQTESGSLNLRVSPQSGARVLKTIPRNQKVQIVSYGEDWCHVLYDAYAGYVMTSFLRFEFPMETTESFASPADDGKDDDDADNYDDSDDADDNNSDTDSGDAADTNDNSENSGDAADGTDTNDNSENSGDAADTPDSPSDTRTDSYTEAWVLTPSSSLNMRAEQRGDARVITSIPRLAKVKKYSEDGNWSYVSYKDKYGYVATNYLTDEDPNLTVDSSADDRQDDEEKQSSGATLDLTLHTPDEATFALVAPVDGSDLLGLWSQCTERSSRVADMLRDELVEIVLIGDSWCLVQYFDYQGYCLTEGLEVIPQ